MLRIGEFSVLSQITINMLRHYDEIGLLQPEYIDHFTGYRYYSEDQLPAANKILALKGMGFSLPSIRDIMVQDAEKNKLKHILEIRAMEQRNKIFDMQRQLGLIEAAIRDFDQQTSVSAYSVTLKYFSGYTAISYRDKIALPNQEGILWEKMFEVLQRQHVRLASPRLSLAIFHDESFVEENMDVEVQRAIVGKYEDEGSVHFKHVKAFTAATLIFQGNYTRLPEVNEAIARWIANNHYQISGPHFNIYHRSPEAEKSFDNMVTEVCFPVERQK